MCVKLRAKLRFSGFLSVFGNFSHEVVQAWFIYDETWHTKLFGINYSDEVFGIENNTHMLEIMCLVAFFRFLKCFWHLFA